VQAKVKQQVTVAVEHWICDIQLAGVRVQTRPASLECLAELFDNVIKVDDLRELLVQVLERLLVDGFAKLAVRPRGLEVGDDLGWRDGDLEAVLGVGMEEDCCGPVNCGSGAGCDNNEYILSRAQEIFETNLHSLPLPE
jgi:hypothetical protein